MQQDYIGSMFLRVALPGLHIFRAGRESGRVEAVPVLLKSNNSTSSWLAGNLGSIWLDSENRSPRGVDQHSREHRRS
jgi:hypothetical protein